MNADSAGSKRMEGLSELAGQANKIKKTAPKSGLHDTLLYLLSDSCHHCRYYRDKHTCSNC